MRTLILYESNMGSTKKYAEDIGKAVNGEVFPLKKFKWKKLSDYDCIVFGGWVRGNAIQGINKFLSHWDDMEGKEVIIFSCGLSVVAKDARDDMINLNLLYDYHLRYYMIRGQFDFNKLDWRNKLLMNTNFRHLESRDDLDENEKAILALKTTPLGGYDQYNVNKVISVINKIALEKTA